MYYLNSELLYLVPVAACLALLLVLLNYRRRVAAHRAFGDWQLLSGTSSPLSRSRYVARGIFAALCAASLVFALCRPTIPNGTTSIAQGTVDVIAVVDVSRSMAAMDYDGKVPLSAVAQPLISEGGSGIGLDNSARRRTQLDRDAGTRLEMVRHVLLDYMLTALSGNQLGIVSYAGEPFPQAFLTRDTNALRWVIDRGVTISSAPGEGSAMGKALHLALDMFDADSPDDHEKVLVLFSDGGNDDEAEVLLEFTSEAKARGIKVVVVAMGNVMPAKIPVSKLAADDPYAEALASHGKRWYEVDGQVEKTAMNSTLLQALANKASGQYIHLIDSSDLDLMDHVGNTAKANVPGTMELFPWALGFALLMLIAAFAATKNIRRAEQ